MGEGWKELFSWPTSGEARHFVGGWEKHHGRYYRSRGLGSFGAAGRQDGWQSPNRCLRHAVFTQRGKQRNTAGSMASLSQPLPKRACSAILLPSRDLREPVGGIQSPGRRAGNSAKQPFPFPRPPKRAPAPSDWGWTWVSHDSGRGNSAVYWLRLETSPRGAPSCTPVLVDGPNLSRRGNRLRPRTEVVIGEGYRKTQGN